MEYIITYGWAILIITIVIVSLYALGIFNPSTYASKAQAGGCQVYRPYGPGSVQLINLQGVCNSNEPKFAAFLDGKSGSVSLPDTGQIDSPTQLTISIWMKTNGTTASQDVLSKSSVFALYTTDGWLHISFAVNGGSPTTAAYPTLNTWENIVATYNSVTGASMYINGGLASTGSPSGSMATTLGNVIIGNAQGTSKWFGGIVSNVQIYNRSFSANQVEQLYIRGIGAPPSLLQNLVGWWPLNGDTNDYSGNGDNGVENSIFFSTSWTNGYAIP